MFLLTKFRQQNEKYLSGLSLWGRLKVRLNCPKKQSFFESFFSSKNGKRIFYANILFLKRECSRKMKGGYMLTEKNNRFWSLLILLLSVVYIRRKRLILKNVASIQIQKVAIYDSDRSDITTYSHRIIFDAFVDSYIS